MALIIVVLKRDEKKKRAQACRKVAAVVCGFMSRSECAEICKLVCCNVIGSANGFRRMRDAK